MLPFLALFRRCAFFSCLITVSVAIFESPDSHAELILSAPPRESAERGIALYTPLAKLLSEQLDEAVVYEHPRDWIEYATKMKQDHYDIIFDGPHFAAWRIKHLDNAPIAKLPGQLVFMVVTHSSERSVHSLHDLMKGVLCGIASPALGTMVVIAAFDNPILQPDFYEVGDFRDVYKSFKNGKCNSAVLQERFYNRLPAEERAGLRTVYTSVPYPDQTITVSRRVNASQRAIMAKILTARSGLPEAQELLTLYGKKVDHFEVARLEEFAGMENLLEGVIWGW